MALGSVREERFDGLTSTQAARMLAEYGPNALPELEPPSFAAVFLRQFLSSLIYILLAAAMVSVALGDFGDAAFIGVVLLINGLVGAVQEFSAGRAAAALKALEQPRATVFRDHIQQEVDARTLVPGDVVLIEAGGRNLFPVSAGEWIGLLAAASLLSVVVELDKWIERLKDRRGGTFPIQHQKS